MTITNLAFWFIIPLVVFAASILQIEFGVSLISVFLVIACIFTGTYILQGYKPFSFLRRQSHKKPYNIGNSGCLAFAIPVALSTIILFFAISTDQGALSIIADVNKSFTTWLLTTPLLETTPLQRYSILNRPEVLAYAVLWVSAAILSALALPIMVIFALLEERRAYLKGFVTQDSRSPAGRVALSLLIIGIITYIVYASGFMGMTVTLDGAPAPIKTNGGFATIGSTTEYDGTGTYYSGTDAISFSMNSIVASTIIVCLAPVLIASNIALMVRHIRILLK